MELCVEGTWMTATSPSLVAHKPRRIGVRTRPRRLRRSRAAGRPRGAHGVRHMPLKVLRDAVHDFISIDDSDEALLGVIDSFAFQRLRRIHQNGVAFLAYHGLEGTRFGHALGTYEVARRVTRAIEESQERIAADLGVYRLQPHTATAFRAACLLHDLGHTCFSHLGERFFQTTTTLGEKHEEWTLRIVQEDSEIHDPLSKEPFYEDMVAFLEGTHPFGYLQNLFAGNLDVDRFDYLNRDTRLAGTGYGLIDVDWIVRSLELDLVNIGYEGPRVEVVFDSSKGAFAIEHFLLSRRAMYAQIYFHKAARAAEGLMIAVLLRALDTERFGTSPLNAPLPEVFGELANGDTPSVDAFLRFDDTHVLRSVVDWSDSSEEDPILQDLSDRLMRRRLFKAIEVPKQVAEAFLVGDKAEECEERLKSVVRTSLELSLRENSLVAAIDNREVDDYYFSIDVCRTSVYEPGEKSILFSRDLPGGQREHFPIEADPQLGPKFARGTISEKDFERTFVIVPSEARDGIREVVEQWRREAG